MICQNPSCGREINPLDKRRRKFCCKECCDAVNKRKKNFKPIIEPEFICPHNEGVSCWSKKCSACGWNPMVAKKRMEAYSG